MRSALVPLAALSVLLALAAPAPAAEEGVAGLIAAADPEDGRRLFLRCKACHTADEGGPHRLGPNLWDVVGREKASAEGFRYSPALRRLEGVWSYAALDGYLEDPSAFAPGNRMVFPGLKKAGQRAAVIAYLRTLSDAPEPLPAAEAAAAPPAPPSAPEAAPDYGGLPPGEGRAEVHAICGACHSLRLVTQQGLDADRWDALMDWMTEKQGMPALEGEERRRIVGYLATHFGQDQDGRRADPMRPAMPPMPTMQRGPMAPARPPPP